jgi:hypothetical protein
MSSDERPIADVARRTGSQVRRSSDLTYEETTAFLVDGNRVKVSSRGRRLVIEVSVEVNACFSVGGPTPFMGLNQAVQAPSGPLAFSNDQWTRDASQWIAHPDNEFALGRLTLRPGDHLLIARNALRLDIDTD